jgi:hypothetical protein
MTVVRSGVSTPTSLESLKHLVVAARAGGGEMLFKIGIVLLIVWLMGVVGAYSVGDRIHILLLAGLLLLLLSLAKARDAAAARYNHPDHKE